MNEEQYQNSITRNNYRSYQGNYAANFLVNKLKKYIKSPILDIGAGTGALVKELEKKNFKAFGIDPVPKNAKVQKGSIGKTGFPRNSFNTIFCSEVIEHLSNRQIDEGIIEIKKVLIENGNLIITVPFDEDLEDNSFTCPNCNHRFHKFGHLQSFTKERIRLLLEENGFKIIFLKIFPIGVIAKLPLGRFFYPLFLRFNYDFISKTIIVVAQKI